MSDLVEKWRAESEHRASIKRLGMKDMLAEVERLTAELFAAELRAKTYEEGYNESQEAIRYHQARVAALEAMLGRWSVYEYLSDDYKTRLRRDSAVLKGTGVET